VPEGADTLEDRYYACRVTVTEYALWGMFGGFAVEGLEFAAAIRRTGTWPWLLRGEPGPVALLVSVVIRLAVGAGLAVACGTTGQVNGPFGALAVGIAAPVLVERIARHASVTGLADLVDGTGDDREEPPLGTEASNPPERVGNGRS
jgi:hypothetical protein